MTVAHLSLLDIINQSTAAATTSTPGDWQHFQDLLKTAIDHNTASPPTPAKTPGATTTPATPIAATRRHQADQAGVETAKHETATATEASHRSRATATTDKVRRPGDRRRRPVRGGDDRGGATNRVGAVIAAGLGVPGRGGR